MHTIIRMPGSVFSPYTSITTNILFFDRTGSTEETWFYRLDMPEGYKHFSKTKPMKLEHFAPAVAWWHGRAPIQQDGFDKAKSILCKEIKDRNYNIDLAATRTRKKEILPPKELISAVSGKARQPECRYLTGFLRRLRKSSALIWTHKIDLRFRFGTFKIGVQNMSEIQAKEEKSLVSAVMNETTCAALSM